ncbi:DUF4134 family protein [Pedobacter sp. GR22-6]|uniref:DUF4134 family protein n=1 Tax=Pedobacter sp. GR22-6 TaxID=3127957 RepID=UPI00307FCC6E
MQKNILLFWAVVILLGMVNQIYAQPGISEFQQVNSDLKRSFFSASDATFILAAIFGICGALRIYYNMQMGKNKFTADVSAWFLAALFMILMGPFLRALFGL